MLRPIVFLASLGIACFALAPVVLDASDSDGIPFSITPGIEEVLESISADSLRGHLSFIASDLLEGRDTPSAGLDIAAEYIAAQFRRAGLEPLGDDGYFQTAHWLLAEPNMSEFRLEFRTQEYHLRILSSEVSFRLNSALNVAASEVFKLDYTDIKTLPELTAAQIEGRVVLTEIPDFRREDQSRWEGLYKQQLKFLTKLRQLKAALVVSVDRTSSSGKGSGPGQLVDPENRGRSTEAETLPWVRVHNGDWIRVYDGLKLGPASLDVSLSIPQPDERPVKVRNVAGLLRGSDPELQKTCVLVSAHYDHVGADRARQGDQIFNGANDDGSGTVSVIELAAALSRLNERPKRSILFLTVFGEEKGLLGSRFYLRHPLFPLEKTIANVNLEVLGRTDTSEGVEKDRASLTGFDYTDLGRVFQWAGKLAGIEVYRDERFSDAFYSRSDNLSFAEQGIPAHTLCAVFLYPDLHKVSDHWDKIDYPNLLKINRTVALALLMVAGDIREPRWNAANRKAERYQQIWRERQKR